MHPERVGPALALAAALLFGLSAPAVKLLVGAVDPWLLAGFLYLGSGVGLGLWRLSQRLRGTGAREAPLAPQHIPWLAGAVVAGGVVGPVLLMQGLAQGTAVQSSLLLNLEGVFTTLLAWSIFREHVDMRITVGMTAITGGAMVLSWEPGARLALAPSALLVIGACLAWAVDNNLTRNVSGGDPVQIATVKGIAAGSINVVLALADGARWPPPTAILAAGGVGFLGYGTSLVFFVLALRLLGAARTGAYFSTAPFLGAVAAVLALNEPVTARLFIAAALMVAGLWLHLGERHGHEHVHEPMGHEHLHRHDEHHQHEHPPGTPPGEPHSHRHEHAPLRHTHRHYPDLHHRHPH